MSASIVVNASAPPVGHALAIVAKRSYRFVPGRPAEPLAEAPEIFDLPTTGAGALDPDRPMLHESDRLAPGKLFTDVLVAGHVYGRGASVVDASLEVGAAKKTVRVHGDRRIRLDSRGRPTLSAASPFEAKAISWEEAYGGRDAHAEREGKSGVPLRVAYPRNAHGRGFFIDEERERIDGALAPSFEDPSDPIDGSRLLARDACDWIDRPAAASFGPIDVMTFPRPAFFLAPDFDAPARPIYEVTRGALSPSDLSRAPFSAIDPRIFNGAPVGLGSHRLFGGERATLRGLHPNHPWLEVDLPGERPRLLLEPPGVSARELEPLLQTILFEPDLDRVTLTWTGSLPTAAPYPEELLMAMRHAVVWSSSPRRPIHRGGFF